MGVRGRSSKKPAKIEQIVPQVSRIYRWYVLYTRCKHEVAAESYLKRCGIETYLPREKVLRERSDRRTWTLRPLFPSYIFVRVSCREYEKALQHFSIASYVTFEGFPCSVPDEQIGAIKVILNKKVGFEVTSEKIETGEKVVIKEGPLAGYQAEVVERTGKKEVILRVEGTNQSIVFAIQRDFLITNE
ncbi:MAG: UpxY family transcription antiterminator [Porphyromonadaceae bacterium]|nr:MAG: UpxY family transcription antiterminator [Porphyromonadaceae bacterium]